ncbi:unnamed protein product [Spirodela intermedia]|uniref:Uncharacterized protein n=2 Tax=Spirodela intermedia TaxID=51605 RepID=A0A7I8IJ19_SPIIN|nr:unnamed protein product [Spirodela intermedia]CAA6657886.1 unnamed protein product [Spirodela intermedia]CAA7394014.1 unnamed protein product [Spirodela intermedia]
MSKVFFLVFVLSALVEVHFSLKPASAISCLDIDLALQQCRLACGCVEDAAAHVHGLNDEAKVTLPAKCNTSLPYPISTNLDCNQ